jgi:hypothetical protein
VAMQADQELASPADDHLAPGMPANTHDGVGDLLRIIDGRKSLGLDPQLGARVIEERGSMDLLGHRADLVVVTRLGR